MKKTKLIQFSPLEKIREGVDGAVSFETQLEVEFWVWVGGKHNREGVFKAHGSNRASSNVSDQSMAIA